MAATWGGVAGWVVGGLGQPVSYNYGDNVYYDGGNVYQGDEVVATADEYAAQAQTIATSVPQYNPDEIEWLPLGVFALAPMDDQAGIEPTLYLQLAVSKEGILDGTLQNTATSDVHRIEGMIDKESQRAAWSIAGKDSPIMEAGISSLTQDEATALLHFADGQSQAVVMVRQVDPSKEPPKQ